ncbi:glycosyltransferase family 4 protein [Streptomyces sp. Rer75]|uniref:glycosyltransferase family 4 protein n=1 Tax=unclassified Streptomyces TaxID=2593676 RepID=UPI0015D0BCD8|nr:glycosyltransferase family 4 protein [Streptomyces sp. Rer75]QLH20793.1 glycosyltransferase family 4 protein [Streptomyces sp. Rer75]
MTAHLDSPGSLLGLGSGAVPPPVREVHVVMPGGVDDPATPSGGNTYDRRICRELPGIGWDVHEHTIAGSWPQPGPAARAELARLLAELADGSIVLLDGLVACAVPYLVVPEAERLRPGVLVHLPLGEETGLAPGRAADLDALERKTLRAMPAVVATSGWAARRLVAHHGLAPGRVHVAAPGADVAPQASGTDEGTRLLCVASVTPRKGQHRLVEALAEVADLPWTLECVGGLGQDPGYVERLRELIEASGLGDRVRLTGPRRGAELEASFAGADLLVLASYAETYGMVVTEALAHGVPVLATAVGGVPEALGHAPEGSVPGLLVAPDDPAALTAALRRWLGDPDVRRRLITAARGRRTALDGWHTTASDLAGALERLRREPRRAA